MKTIICLLILVSLLAVGCGKNNMQTSNSVEDTQNVANSNNDGNDATFGGDIAKEDSEQSTVEEIPIDLQIELPKGTTVGEFISGATVEGTKGWLLENPNFIIQREYADVQDQLLWTKTACGWVENHKNNGEIVEDGSPKYRSKYCTSQQNGFWIECGYFCEVSMRVYSDAIVYGKNIPKEQQDVEYWCIIYKKDVAEYTWVYLDKEFFSKEQALAVAESLPETEYKYVTNFYSGFSVYVEYIEGYHIEYPTTVSPNLFIVDDVNGKNYHFNSMSLQNVKGYNYMEYKELPYYRDWVQHNSLDG